MSRFRRAVASAAAVAAAVLLPGCYAYLPVRAEPLVGRPVQATLTDSGTVVLAVSIGPAVQQLRGHVVAESASSVGLAIDEAVRRDGFSTPWRREVVSLPRPLIQTIEVRRFSPTRTALFGGLTAIALISVERGFLRGGGANAPGTAQTGQPGAR